MPSAPASVDRVSPAVECNFQDTWMLYVMHTSFSFVSRVWDMGIILLLADLTNNSLFIVAIAGFLSSGLVVLLAGPTGAIIDKSNRLTTLSVALLVKLISVTVGYTICAVMMGERAVAQSQLNENGEPGEYHASAFVYAIPIVVAIANFSFSMIILSVEKDWIVVLSGGNKEWLSQLNSIMSQIDMACMAVAPILTGWIFAEWSGSFIAVFLLGSNALVTLIFYIFVRKVYSDFVPLWHRNEVSTPTNTPTPPLAAEITDSELDSPDRSPSKSSSDTEELRLLSGSGISNSDSVATVNQLLSGSSSEPPANSVRVDPIDCYCWYFKCICRDFFENSGNCGGLMLAYAVLYMTVLSFGTLMTVYLYGAGMSLYWIGILRGSAALSGFAGAAVYPYCQRKFGLWRTGQWAIAQQLVFVTIAATPLFIYGHQQGATVAAFVLSIAVVCSRAGLWLFDLCVRQIAQELIPESHRGRVNGQWKSLVSFFSMMSYVVAMVWAEPTQFAVLTSISAAMVVSAFLIYTASNCTIGQVHMPAVLGIKGGAEGIGGGASAGEYTVLNTLHDEEDCMDVGDNNNDDNDNDNIEQNVEAAITAEHGAVHIETGMDMERGVGMTVEMTMMDGHASAAESNDDDDVHVSISV